MKDENYYVSDEDKKGRIFAIALVVFLVAAVVLIVCFAVNNKSKPEETAANTQVSFAGNITEIASENEAITAAESLSGEKVDAETAKSAAGQNENSAYLAETEKENSRYNAEVKSISREYDDKIKTNQNLISFIENEVYAKNISEYESKIAQIDKQLSSVKNDPATASQLEQQKAEYNRLISNEKQQCEKDCASYEQEISNYEAEKKAKLETAKKTHEKNLQNISDKYR